jgi:metallopeptidase MepB
MFGIFGHLFGLRFVNADGLDGPCRPIYDNQLPTLWHEDVLLFAVWDDTDCDQENAGFLGYLYLDLYFRPNKRPGFADLPICPVGTDCLTECMNCGRLTVTRDLFVKMDRALFLL